MRNAGEVEASLPASRTKHTTVAPLNSRRSAGHQSAGTACSKASRCAGSDDTATNQSRLEFALAGRVKENQAAD
jgi:hypothetical protein